MSAIRRKTIAGLRSGDSFTVRRTFTEDDVIRFADLTQDYNPVHFDARFAAVKNFQGRICHGLLVAGMLTEVGGQIGWLASGMNFRFKRPVYFGDTITCTVTITEIQDGIKAKATARYLNQDGALVLEGQLFGLLPDRPEKEVLEAMVIEGDPTNKLRAPQSHSTNRRKRQDG
jgi:3-hydroxybutyryl-CoA dehydratase